jgi:heat shock protein HtpX
MNSNYLYSSRLSNGLQSVLLITLMAVLLGYLGLVLAGPGFAMAVIFSVVIAYWMNPLASSAWMLQLHQARALSRAEAPQLYDILQVLAKRASLNHTPTLYYLPANQPNAFAVGARDDAAIALSDGLLRRLNLYELAGVLGHEMSHIRSNDMRVMGFADLSARVTRMLSIVGVVLFLFNLPLMFFTEISLGWMPILTLLFAPIISDLSQFALSRVREFQADLGSVELLGDPRPLMSALNKMEFLGINLLERWSWTRRNTAKKASVLLRTHPTTQERIARLMNLAPTNATWSQAPEEWLPRCYPAPFVVRTSPLHRRRSDRVGS